MMVTVDMTHGEAEAVASLLDNSAAMARAFGDEPREAFYTRIARTIHAAIKRSEAELLDG